MAKYYRSVGDRKGMLYKSVATSGQFNGWLSESKLCNWSVLIIHRKIVPRYTAVEPGRDGGPYGPSAGQQVRLIPHY